MRLRLRAALAVGAVVVVTAAGLVTGPPLEAHRDRGVVVHGSGPATTWVGRTQHTEKVPECARAACDRVRITVRLPDGTWDRSGGVQVAVRGEALALYVYRDGRRVAAADAGVATAWSVLLPYARNGAYDAYVVNRSATPRARVSYEGMAEVEYNPPRVPVRDLLPDVEARPQENVTFDRPLFDLFEPPPPPGQNCFVSEQVEAGARLCLRFDIISANVGDGAVDMRFSRATGDRGDEPVVQRIYSSTGSYRERSAGEVEWHPVHGHYHFTGFALSYLRAVGRGGRPVAGPPVRTGRKVSFCLADTGMDRWALKGDDARQSYPAPNCLDPYATDGATELFRQGMSRGWSDRYDWFLPDQYVEVTGVRDGTYVLETLMDPENRLLERSEANNQVAVCVRLRGLGTSSPTAQITSRSLPCPA